MKILVKVLLSIGLFLGLYIIVHLITHTGHYYVNLFFVAFEAAIIGILIKSKK